ILPLLPYSSFLSLSLLPSLLFPLLFLGFSFTPPSSFPFFPFFPSLLSLFPFPLFFFFPSFFPPSLSLLFPNFPLVE
ncbi:hypothetical protein, partial [Streptococcus pyogenes]|uniref:hypothetical protein n=1 Tax=Streptococcus pyogenes TaxID=1314 RepID=UPI001CA35617